GKANVPLPGDAGDPWSQALSAGERVASLGVSAVVFDTEDGFGRVGRACELAVAMGADHLPLAGLSAAAVLDGSAPVGARGGGHGPEPCRPRARLSWSGGPVPRGARACW